MSILSREMVKKNKSEEFREMLKAARNAGKGDTTAKKKKNNAHSDEEEEEKREQGEEDEQQDDQDDGKPRKFNFLKRKSQNPNFQKVSINSCILTHSQHYS